MASSRNTNPFYTEEDDDFGFGSRKPVAGSSRATYGGRNDPLLDDEEVDPPLSPYEELQKQKQMSMNRQLQGTQRAMASIYESERMGIATAEELVQQGEQLDNVENKLDTINQTTKTSQRHLNSIKSVFGGLKNWWKGEPKEPSPEENRSRRPETSLQSSIATSSEVNPPTKYDHPGMRDTRGFYDESDSSRQQQRVMSPDMQEYDKQLDANLDAMSAGLERLKGLGMGLGEEITAQNEQIERITNKAERGDTTIRDQNRQMRHILGK